MVKITVGIHAAEGSGGHDGLTNAELGEIHEFGLGVPQRSFLRAYFDENENHLSALITDGIAEALLDGGDLQREMDLVAVQVEGEIKDRVYNRGVPQNLSKSVRRKRGDSAVALVDTSQLMGSIRGKAETKLG